MAGWVERARRDHPIAVEEDAAVGLVGDEVDRAAVARGSIFDHRCERPQHVLAEDAPGRVVRCVDQHGARAWGDRASDRIDVEVEAAWLDAYLHRFAAGPKDQSLVEEPRRRY